MDSLVDELLLARGIAPDDLGRHRDPRIRDFLPDPSVFQDMDKGATRLADAVQAARQSPSSAIMTSTERPARRL
jgi:single-stranded-DNA-specific exonuclease